MYPIGNHWCEAECARQLYEPLFRLYSVDLVYNGHSHDYERAGPVYQFNVDDECGAQYFTVGSYGTNEGLTQSWADQWQTNPATAASLDNCVPQQFYPPYYAVTAAGQWGANGRCWPVKIQQSGQWCPTSQPPWSRWRQLAYGVGMLDILSPTKAVWTFYSQASTMWKPVDEIVITRADPLKCATTPETVAAAQTVGVSLDDVLAAYKGVNVTAGVDNVKAKIDSVLSAKNTTVLAGGVTADPIGAVAGLARSGADYVSAKAGVATYGVGVLKAAVANKTGSGSG